VLSGLEQARLLVERQVGPDGSFAGWDGREVLCHLAAYAQVVGAALQGAADGRRPSNAELYGRELTDAELAIASLDEVNEAVQRQYARLSYYEALAFWRAMHQQVVAQITRLSDDQLQAPGPAHPEHWSRAHLAEIAWALIAHSHGHMEISASASG
jgi:hypothetical protein